MGRVSGKKAIITGGAQGLGEATAWMLAREGAKVAVTDINGDGADTVAAAINAELGDGTAYAWQHDVTDAERWKTVVKEAHDAMGGLNILINNAGIGSLGSVEDEDYGMFQQVMKVDVNSIFLGCKYAIPLMRDHGLGSIVNISSIAGIIASGNYVSYNTAKAAVRHLSKSIALHCAKTGGQFAATLSTQSLSTRPFSTEPRRCSVKRRLWQNWAAKFHWARSESLTISLMRCCISPAMRAN